MTLAFKDSAAYEWLPITGWMESLNAVTWAAIAFSGDGFNIDWDDMLLETCTMDRKTTYRYCKRRVNVK